MTRSGRRRFMIPPFFETPHPPFGHLLPARGEKGNRRLFLALSPLAGEGDLLVLLPLGPREPGEADLPVLLPLGPREPGEADLPVLLPLAPRQRGEGGRRPGEGLVSCALSIAIQLPRP